MIPSLRSSLKSARFPCLRQHPHPFTPHSYSSTSKPTPTPKATSISNHTVSNKQLLYVTDKSSPGSIFFLPHGTRLFNRLIQFMKVQQHRYGFEEVITPLIYKNKLWKTSGHWENYHDDMFKIKGDDKQKEREHEHEHEHDNELTEDEEFSLKPMNCPGHCVLFSKLDRSYNELPVRYSDFSSLHRNEATGALTGLTRVRRFHQDDGHVFCTLDQIHDEILKTLNLISDVYKVFDLSSVEYHLSTRPDEFIGEKATWETAEDTLRKILDQHCDNWFVKEKDGAFYGPKIDIMVTDNYDKKHQIGTVQLDFNLPQRFELSYTDSNQKHVQPILIHRAVFGSLERFMAILIDNYQGKWPFWLNPRQAIVIPVNSSHIQKAQEIRSQLSGEQEALTGHRFYVDVDERAETVGTRIKDAVTKGYSFILMVGDKDIEKGTVAIRTRDSRSVENLSVDDIYTKFKQLEKEYK